jgi:hypothetical protein
MPTLSARPARLRPCRRPAAVVALAGFVAAGVAPADEARPPRAAAEPGALDEPTVAELQRAAVVRARLAPERVLGLERRMRRSALLPQLRVRLGRGTGQLQTVTDYSGGTRLVVGDQNAWQFEVGATWNLDRLVFHPDEPRLFRETERASAHRERLLREVAELVAERQRLRQALGLAPPASALSAAQQHSRIDEITALLDALTGLDSGGAPADVGAHGPRSGLFSLPRHPPLEPGPGRRPAPTGDGSEAE